VIEFPPSAIGPPIVFTQANIAHCTEDHQATGNLAPAKTPGFLPKSLDKPRSIRLLDLAVLAAATRSAEYAHFPRADPNPNTASCPALNSPVSGP
jgi:hypothetical protein